MGAAQGGRCVGGRSRNKDLLGRGVKIRKIEPNFGQLSNWIHRTPYQEMLDQNTGVLMRVKGIQQQHREKNKLVTNPAMDSKFINLTTSR